MRSFILLVGLWFIALFSIVADTRVEDFLYVVEGADGTRGSAFLMKDNSGVWMVSNYHVVAGKKPIKFINMRNESHVLEIPDEIELAEDRDIIRFRVAETNGFVVTNNYSFDDEVYAFGNSGGAGIITKAKGEIMGMGLNEIEVSCDIIKGNSGGPLVNFSTQVLGVVTFLMDSSSDSEGISSKTDKSSKGTRYENYRRIAYSINDINWQIVPSDTFDTESEEFQSQLQYSGIIGSVLTLAGNRLPISEELDGYLLDAQAIREYNRRVVHRLFSSKKDYSERAHKRVFNELSEGLDEYISELNDKVAEDFTVTYFSYRLGEQLDVFRSYNDEIQKVIDTLD